MIHAADEPGAASGTAGSFSGYVTVWVVCGITALAAAVLLLFVPKQAFTDRGGHAADEPAAEPTAGDVA